jgi:hypothetical protein
VQKLKGSWKKVRNEARQAYFKLIQQAISET